MKGKKTILSPTRPKREQDSPTTVRFKDEEKAHIVKMALRYTGGNVSEWVRYAALNFRPGEVTEVRLALKKDDR